MSYITTYTKKWIDPVHPSPEAIEIRDIAHALSFLCRAGGHFPEFFSVAQHSILCMKEAQARGYSTRVQLGCLLHDASEAYLSDITRPVKAELPRYLEIEAPLQDMIWKKWISPELTPEEIKLIFQVDDQLLYHEFFSMTGIALLPEPPALSSNPSFHFADFSSVEQEFIQLFDDLSGKYK